MKAFPFESSMPEVYGIHTGMDLRDYFAAHASEKDIQDYMWETTHQSSHCFSKVEVRNREQARYAYADAMIKAREKTYEVERNNTMPDRDSTDKS